ncbi:hypothetical protein M758_9G005600 [Ceratodon purpureus]|nr:hypothetical protein M758_9G005600 [Ceratodon purpureus]
MYTKHKISNPLSCPGSVIMYSPENETERPPENQTVIPSMKRKPKSLQDHPVANTEKQDLLKIDIQGKKIQLADLVSYQAQQGELLQKEVERELSGQGISTRKSADGRLMNSSQQQSATEGARLIFEPGVTKSLPHYPAQTKRKGISPIRASCERAEPNTSGSQEGNVMKQPRVKSPNKCPMPKQNADGSDRTGKRQFHGPERAADDIAGPARRWRSREKERDSESWIKDLSDKASPGKTRYHMELVREAAEVEKEVEQFYKGTVHHKRRPVPQRSPSSRSISVTHENGESKCSQRLYENGDSEKSQCVQVTHENGEAQRFQRDASSLSRPPFISSGTIGYKKILTAPLIPRTSRPISETDGSKAAPTEEKTSLMRSVRENYRTLTNAQRGPDLDIVKENLEADEHASPPKERHRPSSGTYASSLTGTSNKGMETSRSWAHPVRPHTGPPNSQEQRKALKTVNGAKWPTPEDQPNDDRVLKDSNPKGVGKDPASPRNRNKEMRSRFETWNGLAGSCNGELIFEIGKPREDNSRKSNGPERQEKRIQEPKMRHKAVWKSYMDEKKQNSRKNLEAPPTVKSEPSSPAARMERGISSRAKIHINQQDDYPSKVGLEQPVVNPNARNCHTPAASVKSLPISRSRNGRDKSVPRSWKYSQESSKGIEVEALENISTKIKSLSTRFHSPVTQVPQDTSPVRRNRKDLNFKEKNDFPAAFSTRREKPRKLQDIRSSSEMVPLHPNGNLAEKEGSTRKDVSPKSASNVADTLITAWKTGKFQDDYVKAMKRAKEITSGSSSSGISKIFSDRNYSKPWLSRSPFRRSLDREVNDVSLDSHGQNQRSASANPRTNHKSPLNRSRNKPWLSNLSSRSSPERMMDDQSNQGRNHRSGSANLKTSNRSPMSRSNAATMLSPKRTNWTPSLWGPESSKSSPERSRVGRKETTKDPWEGQSLDFVLGSLAEQVRELDERLRSATVSSPALSSSSSLSREAYVNRDKQAADQPAFRMAEKLYEDRGSPSTSSVASSPERDIQRLNPRGPPAARYISRGYTNGNARGQKEPAYRAAGRPATTGTYMDELKTLLKEISSDNPSPIRRNQVTRSPVTGRRVERESKPLKVQAFVKKTELLHSMNKNGITRPKVKADFEPDFVSSTSANTSRACSVASQRDTRETRVMLMEKGRAPIVGNGSAKRASSRGRLVHGVVHDGFYGNGNTKVKGERERDSDRVNEVNDIRETNTYERRSEPQENGFREDNGIRRVMEKRLVQSRWTPPQVAENVYRGVQERLVQSQERFEKRTVEVRGCAPQQVIHNGHAVVREQLVKEVVENGLPSPEMNGHDSLRRNAATPGREQNIHKDANGKVTPVKEKRNDEEFHVPQRTLSNGKFATNGNGERGSAQPRGPPAHHASNGHKMITEDLRRRPMQQMEDQTRDYALSNGAEKLKSARQPESPLWVDGSPHCSGSWRKGAMNPDEIEDRMLLSGSVDFSPWNTEKLPDIGTPQTSREKKSRSKPPSPIAEDAADNGSLSPKIQRAKTPPKLNKAFGQRPIRKDAQPNGEAFFIANPTPVREPTPANTNSLKSQVRPNLKKPKPVPRGIDALWSLNDQDTALKPSAAQNGFPPTRTSSPAEKISPAKNIKRRTASVPKSRLIKEQSSSPEEMPDSTSKSSQDDNYLPVIMAKDPESRQRVIERRKKALQLDMEHRQRLARNLRPTSARSSA